MRLYNLGKVEWVETQLIYHALALLGREGLSLVSPSSPYVCIGFHQDVRQEVALDFCDQHKIPVFRRDLGGGAVYLDGDQLFFHLVLHKDNPAIPKNKQHFYQKFIQPVVNVYRKIGINAEYKPINDVIVGARKISGTGVGEIGDCIVFVGNLIVDFNYDMMAKVLNVPDEKFRDKIHKSLKENLSTIRRELGAKEAGQWDEPTLNGMLAEEFQKLVGPMESCQLDDVLVRKMKSLKSRLHSPSWLFQKGKKLAAGRDVKIRSGATVMHRMHKAQGGLIRADFEIVEDVFGAVSISGDFFCFPEDGIEKLEARLEGMPITDIRSLLESFNTEEGVEIPGITAEDWLKLFAA